VTATHSGAGPDRQRLDRLRGILPQLHAEAILVVQPTNVRYLTGFSSSNAALVVDGERGWLLTDGRYVEAAQAVSGVEALRAERDLFGELAKRLPELVSGSVAFEADRITVAQHEKLVAGGAELVPVQQAVERLRAVKDEEELDAVRRSARLLDAAFEALARERVVGRTEAEIAWWMERTIRELGAEAVSFSPIVASGPNAARPHHHPGDRAVGRGELLIVDAGAVVDGYCSDCTRTFATGPVPPALERAYEVCLEAQERSLEAVAAGAAGRDVDAVARNILREHGFDVLHGLGHGVGLDIHEEPRLSDTSTDDLVAGNVVTVEPGVYLPGEGGVRIEDLVVVGTDGAEVLSPFTKELLALG
jgi:Xaa-Pro aminopeptidase